MSRGGTERKREIGNFLVGLESGLESGLGKVQHVKSTHHFD